MIQSEIRTHSSTSVILRFAIQKSDGTGDGKTGLTEASSGLKIGTICDNEASPTSYTVAGSTIETISTLGTYAAPTATKCRFKEVDSTNNPGLYELHLADARFAIASAKMLSITISGVASTERTLIQISLTRLDLQSGPGVAVSSIGNNVITDASLASDAESAIATAVAANLAQRLLS